MPAAEEREHALGEDHLRDRDRRDDEQRPGDVRQHVAEHDPRRALTERARRGDEVEAPDLHRLRADDPRGSEPTGEAEGEQDGRRRRPIERGARAP